MNNAEAANLSLFKEDVALSLWKKLWFLQSKNKTKYQHIMPVIMVN